MTDFEEPTIEPVIDDRTPNFGWPMVHKANNARETDTHRMRSAIHAVDAELAELAGAENAITGEMLMKVTDYSVQATDRGKTVSINAAGPATVSLPLLSEVSPGFQVRVMALGAGSVTITPQGGATIQGSAGIVLIKDQSAVIWCDGTKWYDGALSTPRTLTAIPLIDKHFLFAEDYGVHGDDYVSASNLGSDKSSAIISAVEAGINSGRQVILPEGKFRMDSAVDWQQSDHLRLRMAGAGDEATQFVVNGDVNHRGALRFEMTNATKWCNFRMQDFGVRAASQSTTGFANCGTAVQLVRSPAPGLRGHREATFERISIESLDNTQGYFERQFDLEGLWSSIIKDSRANQLITAQQSDTANAYRNNWIAYTPESALHVRGCYGFVAMDTLFRCGGGTSVDGASVAAGAPIIFDTSGKSEGGLFIRCVSNFGKIGVLVRGEGNEPGFSYKHGHINSRDILVFVGWGRTGTISDNLLYLDDGSTQKVNDVPRGPNPDSIGQPVLIEYGPNSDGGWIVSGNTLHYVAHTNDDQMIYVWSRANESRNYMFYGNKHNFPEFGFKYGFYSGVKHKITAGTNEWCDAVTAAWANGGAGYQYEDTQGNRVLITGLGDPNTYSAMPRVVKANSRYLDALATGHGEYRYNGTAWVAVTA